MNNENNVYRREQELIQHVNSEKLMEYTRNISQWVRISGTKEELESLGYVESLLNEFGYSTKYLSYPGFISYPIKAEIEVLGDTPLTLRALGHSFSCSTPQDGVTAPIVLDMNSCAASIVLFDGLPKYDLVREATSLGAVGVIFAQDEYLHNMPVNPIWGNPTRGNAHLLPQIPVVSITRPNGKKLRDLCSHEDVLINVRSEIRSQWVEELPILVADLPSAKSDKFILLSCHIDSWDYGAMDNGSANATAIECARILAHEKERLIRGLRICFWSGHSQGKFCGSAWYADKYFDELSDRCVAHVNVDSTGGKGAEVIEEAPVMPHTFKLAASVIEAHTGAKFIGKRIGHFADQSFYGAGISSLFGTLSEQTPESAGDSLSFKHGKTQRASGLGWWWHTEHDTIDKVDPKFLKRDTQIYLSVLWRLLTLPILPFDFLDAVQDLETEILALQSRTGESFCLQNVIKKVQEIKESIVPFSNKVGNTGVNTQNEENVNIANEAIQKIAKHFVRAQFTGGDIYDYDLGVPMTNVPSLADAYALEEAKPGTDEYYMLQTSLQRGVNRLMGHLLRIESIVKKYLET